MNLVMAEHALCTPSMVFESNVTFVVGGMDGGIGNGGDANSAYMFMDTSTLQVYTKPFSLLPLSAVEKPGNLVMQGLLDRLVPLLAEKLHSDYCAWVEQQMNSQL
ncbi:hypothetical protein ZIOFF_069919 [Zingiber officinale]|uniref:Uncharacterized protein n=1 Tax=Zingiber officinale TaxID=94328 RepID=A0A8J5C4T9_ZINOF|nr:hypothetical protein ZIOFF_069919 [Zingiber officinale]